MLHRPEITDELIGQINAVINEHPEWHRTRISEHLCEIWGWRMPNGQVKSISCRDMLRALDKAGKIRLPAQRKASGGKPKRKYNQSFPHDETPIEGELSALRPLCVDIVEDKWQKDEFKAYIEQFHYLGWAGIVGENMMYMVYSAGGRLLACMLFGSAAWSCRDRDAFIGWDRQSRAANLQHMTNNVRFLIPEWVRVPHLASHILSLVARRISTDWKTAYGHPVYCLETFVECRRFRGTAYKAANWTCVGRTAGLGRNNIDKTASLPIKEIYLHPLHRRYKELLGQRGEAL